MRLSKVIFHFMELFFLEEARGRRCRASETCKKERWSILEEYEHYD